MYIYFEFPDYGLYISNPGETTDDKTKQIATMRSVFVSISFDTSKLQYWDAENLHYEIQIL